jgi:hypothetical protein
LQCKKAIMFSAGDGSGNGKEEKGGKDGQGKVI